MLSNLLEFFKEIYDCVDHDKAVDVEYRDYAKTFDKVPHQRLQKKIGTGGIEGKRLHWLTNLLRDWRQKIGMGGIYSEWQPALTGVPQGSALGLVLFCVYINNLDDGILSKISKFADDTKLARRVCRKEDVNALQEDLNGLFKWAEDWQMLFNVDKCSIMHVGCRNTKVEYEFEEAF